MKKVRFTYWLHRLFIPLLLSLILVGCEDDPILDPAGDVTDTGGSYGKMHAPGFSPSEDSTGKKPINPEVF